MYLILNEHLKLHWRIGAFLRHKELVLITHRYSIIKDASTNYVSCVNFCALSIRYSLRFLIIALCEAEFEPRTLLHQTTLVEH